MKAFDRLNQESTIEINKLRKELFKLKILIDSDPTPIPPSSIPKPLNK